MREIEAAMVALGVWSVLGIFASVPLSFSNDIQFNDWLGRHPLVVIFILGPVLWFFMLVIVFFLWLHLRPKNSKLKN